MTGNGERDATVTTLTAEVRVLMVGSRQVTLSVYGQLDEVDWKEVAPFGRVNPREAEPWQTWIVGRHRESGILVRSWILTPEAIDELDEWGFMEGKGDTTVRPAMWVRSSGPEDADQYWELRHQAEAWRKFLPLIVLAGLR